MHKNNPNRPCYNIKYTDQEVLDDIKRVAEEYNDTSFKTYKKYGKFSEGCIDGHFGNYTTAIKMLGLEMKIHRFVTKEELIEDIKKVFEQTGITSRENYLQHGKYSRQIIKNHFGSWNNMLIELGYKVNMYKPNQYTKDDILDDYLQLSVKYGELIGCNEYRNKGKFSQPIIDHTFGSFTNMKKEIKEKFYDQYKELFDKEIVSSHFCSHMIHEISEVLGTHYYREYIFDWLINDKTGSLMYVDAYFPDYNLVIEVDGAQHYRFVPFIHVAETAFEEQKYRDQLKEQLCKKHGIDIIRIKYDIGKKKLKQLKEELYNKYIIDK